MAIGCPERAEGSKRDLSTYYVSQGSIMSFTLSYTYRDKRMVTKLTVDNLTPYAAVCYVLLQSGAVNEGAYEGWPKTYDLVEVARCLELTDIRFRPSH